MSLRSWRRGLLVAGALTAAFPAAPRLAAAGPGVWVRCPPGLRFRHGAQGESREAWCEKESGVRQGPGLEVSADGHRREGAYLDGRRHGDWRETDAAGGIVRTVSYWHAIAGREIADPEGLCPAGSTRVRVGVVDGRPENLVGGRVEDQCLALDAAGNPIQEGPTVTFLREVPDVGDQPSCPLSGWVRGITAPLSPPLPADLGPVWDLAWYRQGVMHGTHRRWNAAGRLVREETFNAGEIEGTATSWYDNGEVRERAVYKDGKKIEVWRAADAADAADAANAANIAEPGAAGRRVARGRLLFDGRPYAGPVAPTFWLRDQATGTEAKADVVRDAGSDGNDGTFTVSGLPAGDYFVEAWAETEPANGPGLPGDMEGFQRFRVTDGMVSPVDVHLYRILHLTAPVDNGAVVTGALAVCEKEKEKAWPRQPLRFAWDGMGQGVEYRYRVLRVACEPWRVLEDLVSGRTDRGEVELRLPPSASGESYLFEVAAYRHGRKIGGLALRDQSANGWRYSFRIR